MKFVVSGNLKRFIGFEAAIDLDADSIDSALHQLLERFPTMRSVVLDGKGSLRAVHRLYLNGEVLDCKDTQRTLRPDDELGILTAIAGG
jgi:sulfur-carrier protein